MDEEYSGYAPSGDLLQGEVPPGGLTSRGITPETCKRYGYLVGRDNSGAAVAIGPVRNSAGSVVAQKLRYRDKSKGFPWIGDHKEAVLFGSHLAGSGKRVAITEGFEDAMALSQALGNSWPVFSILNGATGAKKDIIRSLAHLQGFETVVLMLDQDEPGREATEEIGRACAHMLNLHIAQLPLKDACDMLAAGRAQELVNAFWRAEKYSPRGVLSRDKLRAAAAVRPVTGAPWPFPQLTALTYGRRPGEIYTFGAGVGIGKTEVLAHCIAKDVVELQLPTVVFSSEQTPGECLLAVAGKVAGKRLHVPDGSWTEEERATALDTVLLGDRLFIYDRAEDFCWETIRETLRYLAVSENVKSVYIDNLTAVVAHEKDERRALDAMMKELGAMGQEYGLYLHLISHLTTPEGKAHEEGGRVLEKQFTGSRAIARWSHFMAGLERDKQASDPEERNTTTLRMLKDRYTGQSAGKVVLLKYDVDTGRMVEKDQEPAKPQFDSLEGDF